jgi:hypothetical protein
VITRLDKLLSKQKTPEWQRLFEGKRVLVVVMTRKRMNPYYYLQTLWNRNYYEEVNFLNKKKKYKTNICKNKHHLMFILKRKHRMAIYGMTINRTRD